MSCWAAKSIMNWNWTTSWKWHRLLVALLIAAVATAMRAMFFEGLGRGIPYLTYYPAVMLAYRGQTMPKAKTFDLAKVCHDVIETQRSFIPPRVALKSAGNRKEARTPALRCPITGAA